MLHFLWKFLVSTVLFCQITINIIKKVALKNETVDWFKKKQKQVNWTKNCLYGLLGVSRLIGAESKSNEFELKLYFFESKS